MNPITPNSSIANTSRVLGASSKNSIQINGEAGFSLMIPEIKRYFISHINNVPTMPLLPGIWVDFPRHLTNLRFEWYVELCYKIELSPTRKVVWSQIGRENGLNENIFRNSHGLILNGHGQTYPRPLTIDLSYKTISSSREETFFERILSGARPTYEDNLAISDVAGGSIGIMVKIFDTHGSKLTEISYNLNNFDSLSSIKNQNVLYIAAIDNPSVDAIRDLISLSCNNFFYQSIQNMGNYPEMLRDIRDGDFSILDSTLEKYMMAKFCWEAGVCQFCFGRSDSIGINGRGLDVGDRGFIGKSEIGGPIISIDGKGVGIGQITNPAPMMGDFWDWRENVASAFGVTRMKIRENLGQMESVWKNRYSQQRRGYSPLMMIRDIVRRYNGGREYDIGTPPILDGAVNWQRLPPGRNNYVRNLESVIDACDRRYLRRLWRGIDLR